MPSDPHGQTEAIYGVTKGILEIAGNPGERLNRCKDVHCQIDGTSTVEIPSCHNKNNVGYSSNRDLAGSKITFDIAEGEA